MVASGQSLMPEGTREGPEAPGPRRPDRVPRLEPGPRGRASNPPCPSRPTVRPVAVELYFLPIKTRMPLKFGPEITTEVTCARVRMTVEDCARPDAPWAGARRRSASSGSGRAAELRGATPGPAEALRPARRGLGSVDRRAGHPMEVGHHFLGTCCPP